jgi:hypothetical protein
MCHVCSQSFLNGQALGGHMSRTHPFHSEKYKLKKEIRQSRTAFRQALNEAKTELLKRYNLSYVKLSKGKENKKMVKDIIYANKDEYRTILLEIKKKLNLQAENNNKKEKICK